MHLTSFLVVVMGVIVCGVLATAAVNLSLKTSILCSDEEWLQDRISYVNEIFRNLSVIPKRIHVSWKIKDILSPEWAHFSTVKHGLHALRDLNPEYELIFSDDADVEKYLQLYLSQGDYALIKPRKIVEKVDLWRYLKMYHEGGIYSDIDRVHDTPFRDVLVKKNLKCFLSVWKETDFSQDILISAPGNEIYRLAIQMNLQRRREGWVDIMALGPCTLFHAACYVLLGEHKARKPSRKTLADLRRIIIDSDFLDTFAEDDTRVTFLNKNGYPTDDKDAFYKKCNVIHWTSDS